MTRASQELRGAFFGGGIDRLIRSPAFCAPIETCTRYWVRPSQEKYVEIARIDQGIEGANIIITHTSGELNNEIPSGRYTFNIEAYASYTTPMIEKFSISINECGQLRLETDVD